MNILIVKTSSMGDILHTFPAAQALRKAFPQAKLGWVVEPAHAEVLKGQPWLDETILWRRKGSFSFFQRDFLSDLRRTKWDMAIDFQGLFKSGLISRLSGAKQRVGFAPARELAHWFYTKPVPLRTLKCHAVERYLDLAAALGADPKPWVRERPYLQGEWGTPDGRGAELFPLHPTAADREAVDQWLQKHDVQPQQQLVILTPDCRREANRWPPERFAHLAEKLLEQPNVRVALSGGPGAKELCDEVAAQVRGPLLRADGKFGLLGSSVLFSQASVLVTGDSGPMHLAAAVELPSVSLLGPTNPLRTGPYCPDSIVLQERMECQPCYAKRCPLQLTPSGCWYRLTVHMVLRAVQAQLSLPATERRCA